MGLKHILNMTDAARLPCKVLGMKLGFVVWLVFYGTMSQINLADIGSDSMFAGSTLTSL